MDIKEIKAINKKAIKDELFGELTDGDHTINELYEHRAILLAALIKDNPYISFKSKLHSDGTMYDDYFIVGIRLPYTDGYITYHYQLDKWDLFKCKELERAPEWDGATPEDSLKRFLQYVNH